MIIKADELLVEVVRLENLLKNREPELASWNMALRRTLDRVDKQVNEISRVRKTARDLGDRLEALQLLLTAFEARLGEVGFRLDKLDQRTGATTKTKRLEPASKKEVKCSHGLVDAAQCGECAIENG